MPVKTSQPKRARINIANRSTKKAVTSNEELETAPVKPGKPVDLDMIEAPLVAEDKVELESLPGEEDEESLTEELGLDEEELNPFGDKWEQ